MKKLIAIMSLLIMAFSIQEVKAQLNVRLGVNIGSQPVWGPTGYDHAEYYYMPDIEAYYNVPKHQYVYQDGGRWIFSCQLTTKVCQL